MRPISPSQVKLYRTCPRRWNYRYIDGIKEETSEAAAHGGAMHQLMENYVLRGTTPTHKDALSAVPHAPRPLTALAERKVTWDAASHTHTAGLGYEPFPWSYLGIIDFTGVLLSLANMRLSPFLEPGAPVLFGDYKFTSNIKYALEVDIKRGVLVDRETLKPDPQFAMYADYFYTAGYTDITGKWIYTTTKGKTRTVPIVVRPNRQAIADVMGGVERDSAQIHKLYTIRPKSSQVRYDRGGCNSFNKPCPHLSYCELPRRSITIDETEGDDMGFADALMSTFPGDPTDCPPIEGEEPPAIPEDMPDLPEDERGEMSEAAQLELIAHERARLRAEEGTTESGFVNPPGAPETAPKDPEEAFARFGTPVVEKPKKEPARKFVAKDKAPLLAACVERGLAEKGAKFTAAGLAKLLRDSGVDPGVVVDEASAGRAFDAGVTILSQEGVTEEVSDLIDMEKFEAVGKELAELDEPPLPEDEGIIDQVEHNLTGDSLEEKLREALTRDDGVLAIQQDHLAELAEGMRLAADEMSKPTVVPGANDLFADAQAFEAEFGRKPTEVKVIERETVRVEEPATIVPPAAELRPRNLSASAVSTVARMSSVEFDHAHQVMRISGFADKEGKIEQRLTPSQCVLLIRVLIRELEEKALGVRIDLRDI